MHPSGMEGTQKGPGMELAWKAGLEISKGKDTCLGEEVTLCIAPKGSRGVASVNS